MPTAIAIPASYHAAPQTTRSTKKVLVTSIAVNSSLVSNMHMKIVIGGVNNEWTAGT